ncbi:hypothetical protein PHYSODRAFT_249337 [Phytophthora sojae]|uniref:Retrotransposon gag domain-containing protein n=1 Tax=Phytophthora sojae (strain P6497) TaxID=1094619 RepID=G5A1W4_PHYSP|nr:hypothetical protein PHYSODRAFT_249337 [Phytophthora sojae]EGZ10912.1 hypothetical protein PHYSODRAFT_249337 [Phytophthora sojae]|eukprot:XP_009533657.1 hypothetical protein PHYSODRAFT_249337 [Phytophthora sojae]
MDEDTQLFLGPEVVMRLQLTGLRPRSPTSSVEGEPSRKRALLTRASASGSIPSYHKSGEAPAETALGFRNDRVPSMVGASSGSDMSLMVTDEGGNLSGLSSSGYSLMSMTDYMVATGTHMPMSTATVMRDSATTMSRSSFPGMMISVTPQLTQDGPVPARAEQKPYRPEHPAQIPLPGSPESKRPAQKQAETRQVQSTGFRFTHPSVIGSAGTTTSDNLPSVERDYRRALQQSEATTWTRLDAEQNQRRALEARLSAALADNQAEQARLQEEYRKLQATNVRMSEAQQQAKTEQQKRLEALEKLAQRRAAEKAEKRKADEVRAQQPLQVQKAFQEAEFRAMQAEQRKAQEERAAEIKTEHELELLRLREKHAQAEAEHQRVMQEQEENTRQLLAAQEQPGLNPGPVASTAGRVPMPADPLVRAPVVTARSPTDPVLAQLAQLTSVMQQWVQANQVKSEVTGMSRSAGKTQGSAKRAETKSKPRASSATSGAKGKARATKPGRPGYSDGDDSSSILETRVVVQAMIPHDALEKIDEKGPLEDRVNWWERFMYYATMVLWDEKTRVVQLRMRLTGSLKDWCTQLPDDVRSDWKKLSHVFKKEWCRTLSSKTERYYSMEMKDSDTPRMFFYRLNHAAKQAGVPYLRPTVDREAHIRRFIKASTDSRLRTTL